MARLRRNVRPNGLRQRLIDKYVDRYHPESSHRYRGEDDLMWNGFARRLVENLKSGAPVELYAWEVPRDARAPFHPNDRVRLVGESPRGVRRLTQTVSPTDGGAVVRA